MKYYPTYVQSLILLVIWFLCTIASVVVILPFFDIQDGLGLSIMYVLSMGLTVIFGLFLRGNWKVSGDPFSMITVVYGFILIICINVEIDPLSSLLPANETMQKLLEGMRSQPLSFFFMVVLAAPILEELMFRGIILDGYLKNYKPLHAILVSSFLFALIHGNLAQGMGAFILGILFGWFYWKTNSIFSVILLHFANNGFAFVGAMVTSQEDLTKSLRETIDNDLIFLLIYISCLSLAVRLIWILHQKYFGTDGLSESPVESQDVPNL